MNKTLALHGSFFTKRTVRIKDLSCQEPLHLFWTLTQATAIQVSALNYRFRSQFSRRFLCLCPLGENIDQTRQEGGPGVIARGTRWYRYANHVL